MAAKQRRLDENLFAQYLKRVTRNRRGTVGGQISVTGGADWRNIRNSAHGTGVQFEDGVADDVVGLGLLRKRDDWFPGANDSGFLAGDFGDGVAQELLMVERNVGDDAQARFDDVGSIKAA